MKKGAFVFGISTVKVFSLFPFFLFFFFLDLRFSEPGKIQPISMISGMPNKEWWNLKKMLFVFLVDIKTFEISAYF